MKFAFLLLAVTACGVAAQPAELPRVTVTVTRSAASPFDVPASVGVIEGDRVHDAGRPEVSIAESLSLVPGVAARDRQNFAQDLQLSIRGFGARSTFGVRGVRLYVDGIPATMPDGQGQLSHIDLASASRIEVLRGPFSVLYGNSSGGVMQVFTESGEGPPAVTGSLAVGSDGLRRPGLRVTGGTPTFGYALSANRLESDGWREHAAVTRDIGNAKLEFRPAEGRTWTLVANTVDLKADDPLGLTRAQFESLPRGVDRAAIAFDTRKTVRQSQLGLVHEAALAGGDTLRVLAYAGTRDTVQFQSIPVATQASPLHPGGVIGLDRTYAGTDLRWTRRSGPLEVVAGLSYDRMEERRRGWQNFVGPALGVEGALWRDEDNAVWNLDPYLQGVWKFAPRWTLVAGVRRSNVHFSSSDRYVVGPNGDDSGSVSYAATLPAAGLLFAVSPRLHAYATAGRGFETPTFNELAYRPGGAPGLNFALRPSTSRNFEIGLKGRSGDGAEPRFAWNAAVFDTRTRDEIVTQTNAGGRSTFQNAGDTRRRGAELEASWAWKAAWRFQLAQTWLDAAYASDFLSCTAAPCTTPSVRVAAGRRIPGTARAITAAELAFRPAQGWRGGIEVRRSGRVFVNDLNSEAAPSFTTVSLDAGYRFDTGRWNWAADLRIDNVADRRYAGSVIVNEGNGRFYEPAAGRSYTLKVSATTSF